MNKVGILICSCDYYKECWKPIIYSFDKYWPDCKYTKYIVSNHESEELPNTVFVKVGDHKGWANDTKKALKSIECDFLIYFQEDYFLGCPVNNDAIESHIQYCIDNNVDYLKISDDRMFRDGSRIDNSDYCWNEPNVRYSINTAVAIWRKELLVKLCVDNFTGWDFERKIIPYIKENGISFDSRIIHSSVLETKGISTIPGNAIQRGMWTKSGVKFLKENGFDDLVKTRKEQGNLTFWLWSHSPRNRFLRLSVWAVIKIIRLLKINL